MDHFPSGQFVFDALSSRGIRIQRFNKAIQAAGASVSWGIDGCADLEAIDRRLRCVTFLSALDIDGLRAAGDELARDGQGGEVLPGPEEDGGLLPAGVLTGRPCLFSVIVEDPAC